MKDYHTPLREEVKQHIRDMRDEGKNRAEIAEQTGVSVWNVRTALGPIARLGELKTFKRDEVMIGWQHLWFRTYQDIVDGLDATPKMDSRTRLGLMTCLGIAHDKIAALAGVPSVVERHIHEHRLELPALAERLMRIAAKAAESSPSPPIQARILSVESSSAPSASTASAAAQSSRSSDSGSPESPTLEGP